MKIGMMCLWNAANGPSIHAELVGRAWVKSGHQLKVFSAKKHPDARSTRQRDEDLYSDTSVSTMSYHLLGRLTLFPPRSSMKNTRFLLGRM